MKNPKKEWTQNEAVEMMNAHAANVLKTVAGFVKQYEYDADAIIDYLIELAEEMEAQALVVALRDELHFKKPTD